MRISQGLRDLAGRLQAAFHYMPPTPRRSIVMFADALIVIESFAVTLLFRFAGNVDPYFWRTFWPFAVFSALEFVLLLNWNGVYQSVVPRLGFASKVFTWTCDFLARPRWRLAASS